MDQQKYLNMIAEELARYNAEQSALGHSSRASGDQSSGTEPTEMERPLYGRWVADMVAERDRLREQVKNLRKALTYCEISTRTDGQWADQAVHTFVLALLKETEHV